jgi:uncharacterized protein (TIGR02145 family)
MQQMTTDICNSMPTNAALTLTDTRNNQNYRVRKMPDGKCWMIDNLKLATPGTALTLTPSDSNVSSNFVIPANPVQSSSTHSNGRCDSGGTMANGWGYLTCNGTDTTQSFANFGFVAYSDPSDTSGSAAGDTEACFQGQMIDLNSTTGCGYLYNWYTATAGTGTYDKTSGYVENSICPKNWSLPKANDFRVLNSAMYDGSLSGIGTAGTEYAQNWWHTGMFTGSRSGRYSSGHMEASGGEGDFWSSSATSANSARYLGFSRSSIALPESGIGKDYGLAVRCLI